MAPMKMRINFSTTIFRSHKTHSKVFLIFFLLLFILSGLLGCGERDDQTSDSAGRRPRRANSQPPGAGEFLRAPESLGELAIQHLEVRMVRDSGDVEHRYQRVVDPSI